MVFNFLKRGEENGQAAPVETKASATGPVIAYHGSGRVAWSPRDVVSLTKTGFAANPVGFRSVKLIAEAAAALPLVLQDAERRYDEHPILDLLSRPNAAQSRAELFEALFGQLTLTGNGYLEAVGGAEGAPLELHVLRSDRMNLVPGANGWPVAYDYAVGAKKHRFHLAKVQARSAILRTSTRRMTIMGCLRCKPPPQPSTCIMLRRVGQRRCSTMRLAPRELLFTKAWMGRRRCRRINMIAY